MAVDQIVVVGSGPAGVNVARPLAESGRRVLMLEAGTSSVPSPPPDRPSLWELRSDGVSAERYLLGLNLRAVQEKGRPASPKLRLAQNQKFHSEYLEQNLLKPKNFTALGICAHGGLSNFWGAVVDVFDGDDLGDCPISPEDLFPSYQAVAGRIGISGEIGGDMTLGDGGGIPMQPPVELSPLAQVVLDRHARRTSRNFLMERARSAVLTEDMGQRHHCDLQGTCMWGCNGGAIYNSAYDIEELIAFDNFIFRDGSLVERIETHGSGYQLIVRDGRTGKQDTVSASTVVLAAGVMPTTRLVLQLQERYDEPVALMTTPSIAFAVIVPSEIGAGLPKKSFGLAQLSFRTDFGDEPKDFVLGLLYGADCVAAPDLIAQVPMSRIGAMTAYRHLASSLFIGLAYLPGEYSRNSVRLERGGDGGGDKLIINGGAVENLSSVVRHVTTGLKRGFRGLGAFLIPGSAQVQDSGGDAHYGCTLPMGRDCTNTGEVMGFPNLYVADGSLLARLPPKHLTFTIMANADRIGRELAARLSH